MLRRRHGEHIGFAAGPDAVKEEKKHVDLSRVQADL